MTRPNGELTCREVVELVTAYLEDALVPTDRERFEHHLVSCDGCRNYLEQMRVTMTLTGKVDDELPAALEAQLVESFRNWRAT